MHNVRFVRPVRGHGCVPGYRADIISAMREVSSPVLDPADAGRGLRHALQALLLGLILLLVL